MTESGPRRHRQSRLISPRRLSDLRQRRKTPAFAPALQALERSARTSLAVSMEPPEQPAGFYHDYFCPDHALELSFDPATPDRHRCSEDGRVFSGEPYDSAWRWFVNNRLSTAAFELSLVWCIDGDEACRRRAASILTGYAGRYPHYPDSLDGSGRDRPFGRGRATFQSLDEAVWLIPLIRAYDLIGDSMRPADRRLVEVDLIRPAAEHLVGEKYHRLHNIECWHNTAIGAAGLCLSDRNLIRIAIDEDFGFRHQLAEGVRDDGLWWEGSTSYHFYALTALMTMAQMWEGAEHDALWRSERLKRMFSAPVDLVMGSDLRLPATNDCWFFTSLLGDVCHGVPMGVSFYEVALGWYGDPSFAWVLKHSYSRRQHARTSLEALLYGVELPSDSMLARDPAPRVFASSGLALLRSDEPLQSQTSVLLKYGPHGGSHGHPDKLSISINAGGVPLSPDLGTPGYGIDLNQTWYRQTISHNTVIVDGRSQPAACGELVAFEGRESAGGGDRSPHDGIGHGVGGNGKAKGGFAHADARVQWAEKPYAGASMRRVVLGVDDGYFVDYFEVDCGRDRQIDWICRFPDAGSPGRRPRDWTAIELEGEGYEHVAEAVVTEADSLRLQWRLPSSALTLFLPCEGVDSRIIRGVVPANPATESSDILIRRRRAEATVFLSVFHPWVGKPTLLGVRPHADLPPGLWGLWVDTVAGRDLWLIGRADRQEDLAAAHGGSADRIFTYLL